MLKIDSFTLGPAHTNCYLVADEELKEAVIIDPAWDGLRLADAAAEGQLQVKQVWLTHAHFDHFGGLADLLAALEDRQGEPVQAGLHPKDLPLWRVKGGAALFGVRIKKAPRPAIQFNAGDLLSVGRYEFQVIHAPGHSPGHVMFSCQPEQVLFAGDVIFQSGIGRTDLMGGNYQTLMTTITEKVLALPADTKIYPGHGPPTSVGEEQRGNPFL